MMGWRRKPLVVSLLQKMILQYSIFTTSKLSTVCGFLHKECSERIWHKETLNLTVVKEVKFRNFILFNGEMDCGDCVEDEWYMVYILQKLSAHIRNCIVQIRDEDGEFLLIEVAEYLSPEITPENTEGKVFFKDGSLHIVSSGDGRLDCLGKLLDSQEHLACLEIQNAISKKCIEFENTPQLLHKSNVIIPKLAAFCLEKYPELICHAIEAFYSRTPADCKCLNEMKVFNPDNSVEINAVFTRTRYAQLKCGQINTPLKFKIPTDSKFDASDLGMKFACGFEILHYNLKFFDYFDSCIDIHMRAH